MTAWLSKLLALSLVLGLATTGCGARQDGGDSNSIRSAIASATALATASATATSGSQIQDGESGDDETVDQVPAEPVSEDDLLGCETTVSDTKVSYAALSTNVSMDPTASRGSLEGGTQLVNVWDVLMSYDPETGLYSGRAAESLTPNDDYTMWTLKIRSGITYGNGDVFVAQDVVDSMQRFLEGVVNGVTNSASRSVEMIDFSTTEVPDDSTVVFRLRQPWATFSSLLGDEAGMIVNPRVIAQLLEEEAANADDWTSAERLVRNRMAVSPDLINAASFGPYQVLEVEPHIRTVLQVRENYWGGPVCIQEIEFTFLGSSQANWEAFQAGEVDAAILRNPQVFARAREIGAKLDSELQNLGGVLLINNGNRDTDVIGGDVRIRQAIHHAVDREAINDRAYQGEGMMTNALAHEGTLMWSPALQECADKEPGFDPEAASALVDEVKADVGWDGLLSLVYSDQEPSPSVAQAIEVMLETAGFDVVVEIGPISTVLLPRVIIDADFDVSGWGHDMDSANWPQALNRNYHSESLVDRAGFADSEMDATLQGLYEVAAMDEQRSALADVQCLWAEHLPSVILSVSEEGIVLADNLKGIERTLSTMFLFGRAYLAN